MKKILLFIMLTQFVIESFSQSYKRLHIGDTLPDITFKDVWNFQSRNLKISDFRGKLLILDFWNINCKACVSSMPKMEKIQQHYSSKIQILMVAPNTDEQVSLLAKRIRIVKENKLPFINGDTILHRLFYFQTVPTHVWINESGKVIHITEGWDTNDSTVAAYFKGESSRVAEKFESEDLKGQNILKLFEQSNPFSSNLRQYSFFTSRIDGARNYSLAKRDSTGKGFTEITFINELPLNMITYAFSEAPFNFYDLRRVSLKGTKASNFLGPTSENEKTQWRNSQTFSYRLLVPKYLSSQALKFMQQDLARFFEISIGIQKQKTKCYVLVCKTKPTKLLSKGGSEICAPMNGKLVLKNSPINGLTFWLNHYTANKIQIPLFINEAHISQNVDIELDGEMLINFDIEALRTRLKQFGLELIEEERLVDKLVISNK